MRGIASIAGAGLLLGVLALQSGAEPAPATLPAFPGAEGFGAASVGGRGGEVVHVTNLSGSGPGSFAAALAVKGPRIIVFDVGGSVELTRDLVIPIGNGRVTVAGQTAPGGITFLGATFWLKRYRRDGLMNEDIILRHIRMRGVHNTTHPGQGGDNLCAAYVRRLMVDHCSFTGSADESIDCCGTTEATFQWCTIEESALKGQGGAQHSEGSHNLGLLFGYNADARASIHHNVFAHHRYRMPVFAKGRVCDFRNNVVYNWRSHASSFQARLGSNLVGNTWIQGPNTTTTNMFYNVQGGGLFLRDNAFLPGRPAPADQARLLKLCRGHERMAVLPKAVAAPPVRTDPCRRGREAALARGGAWPRDATTRRTVREVRTRSGKFGLSGPYERFAARSDGPTSARFDTDRDGMPDAWEKANGLDPKDPKDRNKIVPKGASKGDRHAGYTYVEYYVNDLADRIVGVDGPTCTVRVRAVGPGMVACAHSGRTRNWRLSRRPLEVEWGGENVFNKGSTVVFKAVAREGTFSHWSGPGLAGRKDPLLRIVVDRDMLITAHFARPDAGN